jgi:hypothetical protein
MPPPALDDLTPLQRLIVERALALAKELEATAVSAPEGQIIDRCESLLLGAGRDFLRHALQDTLQSRVEALEKATVRQKAKNHRDTVVRGRRATSPASSWSGPFA